MSSTAESLKNPAEEAASEEPSPKKTKLATGEAQAKAEMTSGDNNNGTTTTASAKADNNNQRTELKSLGNGDGDKAPNNKVSATAATTASNGTEKEQAGEQANDDDEDKGDDSEVFDPVIACKLEEVEDIQTQIGKLNELASEEILKVEQKFNKLRRPHFEKRNALLKEIPNFWLTTLANHPMIAPMIESAEDEDCLHYMVNLDVEEFEDIKSGYKLKFHFVENPYINNQTIVREVCHLNTDEVVTSASPIEFKDTAQGKSLKQIVESSIAAYKRKNRPGQTHNSFQSFFAWFSTQPESGSDDIAEIIKDQIWPSPLEFFFTAPGSYEGGSDTSDDEEEYDEEADDDCDADVPNEDLLDEDLENEELDDDDDDEDEDDDDDGEVDES